MTKYKNVTAMEIRRFVDCFERIIVNGDEFTVKIVNKYITEKYGSGATLTTAEYYDCLEAMCHANIDAEDDLPEIVKKIKDLQRVKHDQDFGNDEPLFSENKLSDEGIEGEIARLIQCASNANDGAVRANEIASTLLYRYGISVSEERIEEIMANMGFNVRAGDGYYKKKEEVEIK